MTNMKVLPSNCFGVRHIQYGLLFIATVVVLAVRISFNIGVLPMISSEPLAGVPTYPEWADKKNVMLSSFFWGYVPPHLVTGLLAKRYGAKWFLTASTLLGSVFLLLIPYFAATFGYQGVIACRVIQGIAQSFLFPCVHTLLSKWTAVNDRAKVGAFTYAGLSFGLLIPMPVTGILSQYEYAGWPAACYLFGAVGVAGAIVYAILGAESPSAHSSISAEEKTYIEYGSHHDENQKKLPTPWRSILTSLPVWAIILCHSGESWGTWTLLSEMPSFFEKILRFNITENSLFTALPYLVLWLLHYIMGPIADLLVTKRLTSVLASRKIFTAIASYIPALGLFSITFVDSTQRSLCIFLLVLSVSVTAAAWSSFNINHIDLAPNHAGTLMGLSTMVGNIFSLLAPLSLDLIISITGYSEEDKELWSIVFYTATVIYLITGSFYMVAGSAEVQPWNGPSEKEEPKGVVHNPSDDKKINVN